MSVLLEQADEAKALEELLAEQSGHTQPLPRSVELRLNLLNYAGFKRVTIEETQRKLFSIGINNWFHQANETIDALREHYAINGTPWQRKKLTGGLHEVCFKKLSKA